MKRLIPKLFALLLALLTVLVFASSCSEGVSGGSGGGGGGGGGGGTHADDTADDVIENPSEFFPVDPDNPASELQGTWKDTAFLDIYEISTVYAFNVRTGRGYTAAFFDGDCQNFVEFSFSVSDGEITLDLIDGPYDSVTFSYSVQNGVLTLSKGTGLERVSFDFIFESKDYQVPEVASYTYTPTEEYEPTRTPTPTEIYDWSRTADPTATPAETRPAYDKYDLQGTWEYTSYSRTTEYGFNANTGRGYEAHYSYGSLDSVDKFSFEIDSDGWVVLYYDYYPSYYLGTFSIRYSYGYETVTFSRLDYTLTKTSDWVTVPSFGDQTEPEPTPTPTPTLTAGLTGEPVEMDWD